MKNENTPLIIAGFIFCTLLGFVAARAIYKDEKVDNATANVDSVVNDVLNSPKDVSELQMELDLATKEENYEKAAVIRDMLKKV